MFDKRAVFLILIIVSAFFANQIYAQGPIIKFDVDTILDKISKDGIESISKEEKEFLDNLNK